MDSTEYTFQLLNSVKNACNLICVASKTSSLEMREVNSEVFSAPNSNEGDHGDIQTLNQMLPILLLDVHDL